MTQPPQQPQQPYPTQPPSYPQPQYPTQPPQQPYPQQPYPTPQPGYGYLPQGQPPYGYPPQMPPQGRGFYKGNNWFGRQTKAVQGILTGVLTLVLLCGCCSIVGALAQAGSKSTSQAQGVTSATNTPASQSTTAPSATATPTTDTGDHSTVGGTISVTDGANTNVAATLVSVKTYAGDDFDKPDAGKTYVIVDVKIHNTGPDSYDYNPDDFYLLDGQGNITGTAFGGYNAMNNQLHYGTLQAGGTVEGQIAFQAPIGDHKAQLTWQPSYGTSKDKFTWALGL